MFVLAQTDTQITGSFLPPVLSSPLYHLSSSSLSLPSGKTFNYFPGKEIITAHVHVQKCARLLLACPHSCARNLSFQSFEPGLEVCPRARSLSISVSPSQVDRWLGRTSTLVQTLWPTDVVKTEPSQNIQDRSTVHSKLSTCVNVHVDGYVGLHAAQRWELSRV